MAKSRWSKEEFDSTFEAFLKTSLSSEEDTEKIKQFLEKPVKGKDVNSAALWWAHDSDDESSKKGKSKSFLKTKKSSESPVRSKSSYESSGKSFVKGKNPASKTSNSSKQVNSPRKAGRRDPQKSKRQTSPGKSRASKSNTSMSKDSLEDISEKSEEHDLHDHHRAKGNTIISINESSIDTSASYEGGQSYRSKDNPGFDTLDELADKQQFFQNLEKEADGTVDYGKLNQDLSQTEGMTLSPAVRQGQQVNESLVSGAAVTPARNQSLNASDSSQQKPSMLSRVALMDSMESTLNTTASPKVANSRDTTQDNLGTTLPDSLRHPGHSGHLGTNTSKEIEDYHRALQEVDLSPTIYGADSRPATGQAPSQATTPVHQKKDVDRSVGDILREMDAIDRRGREIEKGQDDFQLRSDYKSPRSPRSQALQRQNHLDDRSGFENSHTEDTEVFQPVTAVTVKEKGRKDVKHESKERRTTSAPVNRDNSTSGRDRFSHVQSSGYGQGSPPPVRRPRSRSSGKSPPKGHMRNTSPGQQEKSRKMEPSSTFSVPKMMSKNSNNDKKLMQSMETFTKYLKQHLATTRPDSSSDQLLADRANKPGHEREAALMEELKIMREELSNEKTSKAKLQADMQYQEKEFQKQLDSQKFKYEEEVFSLKQENFVLVAKLKELEGDKDSKAKRSDGSSVQGSQDTDGESRVSRLEREIQEQENLLAGYQAENKRLYEEIKGFQKQAKATEGSMFKENQRLTAELTNLRQELEMKNSELQNKGIITSLAVQQQIAAGNTEAMMGANRISHLEGELAEAKRVQESQGKELKMAQQHNFELERHVETLVKEKESLARQLADSIRPDQVQDYEARHKEELSKLEKKIKWYAENQELLDKSNAKLKAKEDEIHRLKLRLEDFKSEAGRKVEENKFRAKEKAADAKKIQDLERQVKEMEQVIRRRHPNSLPAMMMVAANVSDSVTDSNQVKGRSVQVLESRIKKLEKELESKDEMASHDVRGMEQKYNHVKLQFEERIADLEQQLSLYRQSDGQIAFKDHPHSHALALERELDNVRDRCRKQVSEMQTEVDRLTAELNKVRKNQENMMRNDSRQTEMEWKKQIQALQKELKDREHDIHILQQTVEKMRARSGKKGNSKSETNQQWPPFPHAPASSRDYEPGAFADNDMSILLQENQQLKAKVDQLQLELDQQRVDLRRSLAQTESVARQNRERLENQIEIMRSSHHKEMEKLLSDQALHSSTSRVAEIQSKCDAQEVMIRHLQAQLKKASSEADQLPQMMNRERKLQAQIEELKEKLRDAKMVQAPEMRHFESLEGKLTDLVQRQRKREVELDSVVRQNQLTCKAEFEEEVEKWKRVVDAKNQQLQVFRAELDSILEVLRTLQRQGVTLPVGTLYS